MPKNIQLAVPSPCHEDWNAMTPSEKGKFCASCQKQVIDFTNMSDTELALFFKKKPTGSVCGRFFNDQLERNISMPRKRMPWLNYFFQFLIPAFLISCRDTVQGKIKGAAENVVETEFTTVGMLLMDVAEPKVCIDETDTIVSQEMLTVGTAGVMIADTADNLQIHSNYSLPLLIEGIVVDENNSPVPQAYISIDDFQSAAIADTSGQFMLQLQERPVKMPLRIEVSSMGYKTKTMDYTHDSTHFFRIQLEREIKELDSVFISTNWGITKGRTVMGASICIKETKETVIENKLPGAIKLFPNPVQKGHSTTLAFESQKEEQVVIRFLTIAGQLLSSQSVKITKGNNQLRLSTSSNWVSGMYIVQLTDKSGRMLKSEKLILQ